MYEAASKVDTNRARKAQELLTKRLAFGKDKGGELLNQVSSMVIKDSLVLPSDMQLSLLGQEIRLTPSSGGVPWKVHNHALGQLSEVFKYPRVYYNRLLDGVLNIPVSQCRAKLVADLNWHTSEARLKDRRGNSAKYLCRVVDGELRGFLSRVFNRHLASAPLLRAFLSACKGSGLVPVDAQYSPIAVSAQCVVPYVFEVFDGEFVVPGVSWSNSDFGGKKMKVSTFVQRVHGAAFILGDAISEVHIGSVIEDSDIEMSDTTAKAQLDVQKMAITDAVLGQMNSVTLEKVLAAIRTAHEEEIPWQRIKGELGRLLQKHELEEVQKVLADGTRSGYEELPPIAYDEEGDRVATRYWTAAIVGHFADLESDPSRRLELLSLAGEVIVNTKKPRNSSK